MCKISNSEVHTLDDGTVVAHGVLMGMGLKRPLPIAADEVLVGAVRVVAVPLPLDFAHLGHVAVLHVVDDGVALDHQRDGRAVEVAQDLVLLLLLQLPLLDLQHLLLQLQIFGCSLIF